MGKKILIIDDDRTNTKILESRLKDKGLDIYCAFDGAEGLERVKEVAPDLIVLDVEMPGMNGYTFKVELDNLDDKLSSIPVIVLTSHSEKQPIFQLRGVRDYQVKPVDIDKLYTKIADLIIDDHVLVEDLILVIEQNPTQVKLMTHFLGNALFKNLIFSETLEDGLEKAKNDDPKTIILNANIALPEMNANNAAKSMKEAASSDAKIILLFPSEEDLNQDEIDPSVVFGTAVKSSDYSLLIDQVKLAFA